MEEEGGVISKIMNEGSAIDALKESGVSFGADSGEQKSDEGNGDGAIEIVKEEMIHDLKEDLERLREKQQKIREKEKPLLKERLRTLFKKEVEEIEPYNPEKHGPLVSFDGREGYEEIDRYWVNEPYAFVVIQHNLERDDLLYQVVEPHLSGFEEDFLEEIRSRLRDALLVENIKSEDEKEEVIVKKIKSIVRDYAIDTDVAALEKILYYIIRDFVRFGKLDPLMHDSTIEDISCNGYDIPIYLYHKQYLNIPTSVIFEEDGLDSFIIRLAQRSGKHISIAEPMVDAAMPDGSRIQMTLGTAVTSHGSTFTIRKFKDVPITPIDLINWNTFSSESMAYLWLTIENNKSLIFAGGTASGKTSSLNAVSLFIPEKAKIVTLEDTRELQLPHPNWIPGVTRDAFTADERGAIDMYDLLKAALRQRPEYLLVGEVRGKEALTLFQAMSTGHTTFSTMHADSVASAIHRLENPPISVPRTMIQALDIISIQSQIYVKGQRARRSVKIVEIVDIDPTTRNIRTNDIFAWNPAKDRIEHVGESKALRDLQMRRGWTVQELRKELAYRQKILEYLVKNDISDFKMIATIIHAYQSTPEKVLQKLGIA
ncbi:MAG: type II/IV secretion system ATPase subunit [Euryarchaeota archaeon]|nr:type II/IV secretion system ATPase subunit [Euryarchaeota archaeon]